MQLLLDLLSLAAELCVLFGAALLCTALALREVEWVISDKPRPAFPVFGPLTKRLFGKRSASGQSQTPVGKWAAQEGACGQPLLQGSGSPQSAPGLSTCAPGVPACPQAVLATALENPNPGGAL